MTRPSIAEGSRFDPVPGGRYRRRHEAALGIQMGRSRTHTIVVGFVERSQDARCAGGDLDAVADELSEAQVSSGRTFGQCDVPGVDQRIGHGVEVVRVERVRSGRDMPWKRHPVRQQMDAVVLAEHDTMPRSGASATL